MTAKEYSERLSQFFEHLSRIGLVRPINFEDEETKTAINKAQEEIVNKFYEAD